LRAGDWKIVSLAGQPWELYDLSRDRTEMHNVAAENPDRVKEMAAQWDEWAKRTNVLPRPGGKKE
jgi:arylsulfatase